MLNIDKIQQCITPETPLIPGQLHDTRYKATNSYGETCFVDLYEVSKNEKAEKVDCYCSIGKILSCGGVTNEQLDRLDSDAKILLKQRGHPIDGGFEAWADTIWASHSDLLKEYGIESASVLAKIMEKNDRSGNSYNYALSQLIERAREMLTWFNQPDLF